MKCKFKDAVKVSNPLYSMAEHQQAQRAGKPYAMTATIEAEAGYVLEHPQAWVHCCPGLYNATPIAVPVDKECREATVEWLQQSRPQKMAELKQLYDQRHKFKDQDVVRSIVEQAVAYGLVGDNEDPNAELLTTLTETDTEQNED